MKRSEGDEKWGGRSEGDEKWEGLKAMRNVEV